MSFICMSLSLSNTKLKRQNKKEKSFRENVIFENKEMILVMHLISIWKIKQVIDFWPITILSKWKSEYNNNYAFKMKNWIYCIGTDLKSVAKEIIYSNFFFFWPEGV